MILSQRDWGIFVLRFTIGLIFFAHGMQKLLLLGLPGAADFVGKLGFPFPSLFGLLLIAAELLGGLFLIVGLFTRWSAVPPLIVMLVALFSVHLPKGFFVSNGGVEFPLVLLAGLLALFLFPESKLSLTYLLFTSRF